MLIEKAYAKLHGCYEALAFGLIEKTFTDLTFAGHTRVLRAEKIAADEACDVTWECLEASLAENKMVGCGRFLADPYGENASDRQGISISKLSINFMITLSFQLTNDTPILAFPYLLYTTYCLLHTCYVLCFFTVLILVGPISFNIILR
jgi:hypothetical protein